MFYIIIAGMKISHFNVSYEIQNTFLLCFYRYFTFNNLQLDIGNRVSKFLFPGVNGFSHRGQEVLHKNNVITNLNKVREKREAWLKVEGISCLC